MAKVIGSVNLAVIETWNNTQQKRQEKLEDREANRMRRERSIAAQAKAKAAYKPFNMMLRQQLQAVGY